MNLFGKGAVFTALTAVFFAAFFTGCASNKKPQLVDVPLTPELIEVVGADDFIRLYFYVSKPILLERKDYLSDEEVRVERGVAVRVDKSIRDLIRIGQRTPGVATANLYEEAAHINFQLLGIEFEDARSSKLGFAVDLRDPTGKFYLQFDDDANQTMIYDGHSYQAMYEGTEVPYLMVQIDKNVIMQNLVRDATGRTIE